ncbi:hypothetical protein [Ponticoccus alexandrii]|uniref:YrhK domain-containing protein n=1 Tax=Ponticoccus alexandrii TaxID=1943633 RepID=A0ABX7F982_9RHOB|nr:hypothetical protein [Ponticoccus alexandrii]ETA50272.1 hypothetical protein P279_20410 [Rhodobacteraceae bacterium PD-2]QRF67095.1 hypothetical protein GQA70_12715 [Ponticoccus alexandrii]
MEPRLRDTLMVHNERVKLLAGFANAVALGLIGFAILRPLTENSLHVNSLTIGWGLAGLALHGLSHYILGMLRKERPE